MKQSVKATLLSLSMASIAACSPAKEPQVSMAEVAQAAARQDDRVSVDELATWLIEGRADFKLIDVRMPADADSGTIADAENIPIAELVTEDVIARLSSDRAVIVYSNGSENAAKAVVMLRLSGINARLLTGGYNAWHEKILNPDISINALDGEALKISEQRAYACNFVGERCATGEQPDNSEPFVPPVFVESEEEEYIPPPPAEEGC